MGRRPEKNKDHALPALGILSAEKKASALNNEKGSIRKRKKGRGDCQN
jgi:hypothetical protein